MNNKPHPRLTIIDFYDKLVNEIDIYTEVLLESVPNDLLIPKSVPRLLQAPLDENKHDVRFAEGLAASFRNPYTMMPLKFGPNQTKQIVPVVEGSTKMSEYINAVRLSMVDAVKECQETHLEWLKSNPIIEESPESLQDFDFDMKKRFKLLEQRKTFEERLFVKHFCFTFTKSDDDDDETSFEKYCVITNFYLSSEDIKNFEREFVNDERNKKTLYGFPLFYTTFDLDENYLLLHFLWQFIDYHLRAEPKYGNRVFKVDKQSLLSVEKAHFFSKYRYVNSQKDFERIYFPEKTSLDLSHIKSLDIKAIDTNDIVLSGLVNLEHLNIADCNLNKESAKSLAKLRSLTIDYGGKCSNLKKCFVYWTNLEALIVRVSHVIALDFSPLKNLKYLHLKCGFGSKSSRNQLKTLNPCLTTLILEVSISQELVDEIFASGVRLPNLEKFRLDAFDHDDRSIIHSINKNWFFSVKKLKEFELTTMRLKAIKSTNFENIQNLEALTLLIYCSLSCIEETCFSKLNDLKRLKLICNSSKHDNIVFKALQSLDKLEKLELSNFESVELITPEFFSHMKHLNELSFTRGRIKCIDPSAFAFQLNLTKLNLEGNMIKLNADTFKNLDTLKHLNLAKNNLSSVPDGVFRTLANLEILNLCENRIIEATLPSFNGLVNLRELNLAKNQIETFDLNIALGLTKLKIVVLSGGNNFKFKNRDSAETIEANFKRLGIELK